MNDNDDTLISKLISETYTESPENEESGFAVTDLRNYFEKKLNEIDFISINEYLNHNGLKISELTFQEGSHCFRLVYNNATLDFPSNWSIFRTIKNEDMVYVDQSVDEDFLLDIFAELTGDVCNLALIKDSQAVKLVYLPEEESRDHVRWFKGFFEKKHQEKSAA